MSTAQAIRSTLRAARVAAARLAGRAALDVGELGLASALALGPLALGPLAVGDEARAPQATDAPARALGTTLTWAELDRALLDRYAMAREGREILDQLIKTQLVVDIAKERGVEVGDRELDARWKTLDRAARQAGEVDGLLGQLRANRIEVGYFKELLRIALLQERMTRDALGLPPDREVSGDQQEIWIAQAMVERGGLRAGPPPFADGVAGACGAAVVHEDEYVRALRSQLPLADLRDTCFQLLLAKRAQAKVEGATAAEIERAVAAEVERRRREAESDPRYQGVPFEALLGAQGLSLDALRRDPGVRAAALAVLFVEKSHDDASLRAAYDADRERFERAYGEAVRGRAIVLRAARFANDLNPRTFEQAEELMGRIAVQATSEAAAIELARAHNEDADSKARGGDTGWITRGDESVPAELRDALFARLASGGPVPEGRELVGPVRTSNAVVLVWIHDYRPTPTWTEMAELVERELARRFLEDVLPRESVATYLD